MQGFYCLRRLYVCAMCFDQIYLPVLSTRILPHPSTAISYQFHEFVPCSVLPMRV